MSSFDSLTPVESTLQHSAPQNIQTQSSNVKGIYHQSSIVSVAKLSFRAKPSAASFSRPARFSPWLASLAYFLGRHAVVPAYFENIEVVGQENLPLSGPVILAPTHRSRWDAVMVPYAAGHDITGRHLNFMVSADEVVGFQGWMIRHLGGFPVDTHHPAIASLRYGIELLRSGKVLVIFPEGDIFRGDCVQPLKPGLARLALQAEANQPDLKIQIIPIHIHYSRPRVPWRSQVKIRIGTPVQVSDYNFGLPKSDARKLTKRLFNALRKLTSPFN